MMSRNLVTRLTGKLKPPNSKKFQFLESHETSGHHGFLRFLRKSMSVEYGKYRFPNHPSKEWFPDVGADNQARTRQLPRIHHSQKKTFESEILEIRKFLDFSFLQRFAEKSPPKKVDSDVIGAVRVRYFNPIRSA